MRITRLSFIVLAFGLLGCEPPPPAPSPDLPPSMVNPELCRVYVPTAIYVPCDSLDAGTFDDGGAEENSKK